MLPMHDWLLLMGACLGGAMTPGLSLLIIARHATSNGPVHGVVAAVAHAVGIALWATASVLGLAVVFQGSTQLHAAVVLAGAAILVGLAWESWRSSATLTGNQTTAASIMSAGRDGFAIALVNPKVALFFVALFSQFPIGGQPPAGQLQMVLTATLADAVWYVGIAIMIGRHNVMGWVEQRQRLIGRSTAVVLLIIALAAIQESMKTIML